MRVVVTIAFGIECEIHGSARIKPREDGSVEITALAAEHYEPAAIYEPNADFGEVIRKAVAASRARRAAAEPTEAPDAGAAEAIRDAMQTGAGFVRTTAAGQERIDPARVYRHDVDGPAPVTPPTRIDDGE